MNYELRTKYCFFHLFGIHKDVSDRLVITDNVFRPIGFIEELIRVEDVQFIELRQV